MPMSPQPPKTATDEGPPPRYKWSETWPGEGHKDYAGRDGHRVFGRIIYQDSGATKGQWRWALGHIDGVKLPVMPHNGYEKTARLAAAKLEDCYERAARLNGLEIGLTEAP